MDVTYPAKRAISLLNKATCQREDLSCVHAPKTELSHGVTLLRVSDFTPREPVLYEPSAVFVLQGAKHGFVGDRHVVYDQSRYLVLSVPLPFECETHATPENPLLGVYVRMSREVIADLLSTMQWSESMMHHPPVTIEAAPMDDRLLENILRLLETMQSPAEWAVLGPQLVREITYRVLVGPQGHGLRALVGSDGHFSQINQVLQRIHSHFAEPMTIAELASSVGMSPSVFHLHFRAITSTSPMQYIKSIRLHKARSLMRYEGLGASVAATRVGYESASQFGREFKRMFGYSPAAGVAQYKMRSHRSDAGNGQMAPADLISMPEEARA